MVSKALVLVEKLPLSVFNAVTLVEKLALSAENAPLIDALAAVPNVEFQTPVVTVPVVINEESPGYAVASCKLNAGVVSELPNVTSTPP